MQLLLIRHAIAEDRVDFARTGKPDALRPLTDRGRKRMELGVAGLRTVVPNLDVLATSPLTRAVETAEIVAAAYDGMPIERVESLGTGDAREFAVWLRSCTEAGVVAAVGHEPHVSDWAAWFLTGGRSDFTVVKKGSALMLDVGHEVLAGAARLLWFLTPTHMRALGGLSELIAGCAVPDVEIERKFLLTGLPPHAEGHPFRELEQGYLPGKRLQERVRRLRADGREWYARSMKVGTGIRRIEVQEEMNRDLFDALWPLTNGRRVSKIRYRVPDGDLLWEVDRFKDRDLVLAEVELPSEDVNPTPPSWLAPYVVREVTGDPEYLNVNLAR